jgi:hypothetical protein
MDALLRVLVERDISPAAWLRNTPLSLERIQKKSNWLTWQEWILIAREYVRLVGDGSEEDTARAYIDGLTTSDLLRSITGLFSDIHWHYWFSLKYVGPSLWPVVRTRIEPIGHRRLRATIELPDEYEDCPFFFKVNFHIFRHMPALAGLGVAKVEMDLRPRRAVYEVTSPPSQTIIPRAVKSLLSLLNGSAPSGEEIVRQSGELEQCISAVSRSHTDLELLCAELDGNPGKDDPIVTRAVYQAELAKLAMGTLEDLGQDYRRELKEHFDRIQRKNPGFSMRAFANKVGISPSMLSNVLSGNRNLSVEAALLVAQRLNYSEPEARRFCRLVQLSVIADPKVRSLLRDAD